MTNKKSLLQDSLQELENIKNESLELAKEQLINESADLLEKKSAALFEKLIAGEDDSEEEEEEEEGESEEEEEGESEEEEEEEKQPKKSKKKEMSLNEILSELEDYDDEEMDSDEMDSDEMESDEEEMSLDALKKAAEEHGFKLVSDSDDEEEMDSDEMDSDEEELDSDDEEDIEFDDSDEFSDVDVDDKVLAEPEDEEEMDSDEEEEEKSFEKINENFKRNNTKMKNTKKQVLKDLRDVSFNKLVEAYYNMDEDDSFVVKDNYGMEDEMADDDYEWTNSIPQFEGMEDEGYDMEDEGLMYEIDMPEGNYDEPMSDEGYMDEELTDEQINQMLAEMDVEDEGVMRRSERASGMNRLQRGVKNMDEISRAKTSERKYKGQVGGFEEGYDMEESIATDVRDKFMHNPGMPKGSIAQRSELEEMFEEMSMEELEEMSRMLEDDGGDGSGDGDMGYDQDSNEPKKFKTNPKKDYMDEEAEIEEMLSSMSDEEDTLEEKSGAFDRTHKSVRNMGADAIAQGRPDRRSKPTLVSEEEMDEEEMSSLHEKVKKLEAEKKNLQEGFANKVKSLENKVYDVTISALKAGFVNKFLLEHPLRDNEKSEIVYRFANAQTKEQIKETYISLTNEFAKGQTVKDGSLLKESVQNKVGKVHRTDNAIVTEKNLINENDETNRFKQLLNYNFGKRK
jgi:hypothetical protein